MSEMFLLGAGSSVEAGVPETYGMTREVLRKVEESTRRQAARILKFVIGGLLFQKGIKGEDPFLGINIEDLFNAIQLLAERTESEINPFVGSWHPMFEQLGSGSVDHFEFERFTEDLYEPLKSGVFNRSSLFRTSHNLASRFTHLVKQITGGVVGQEFQSTNELLIRQLKDLVLIKDEGKIDYLYPIVERLKNGNCQIATLNYDNAIELLGKKYNIDIDTGIATWSQSSDFEAKAGSSLLLKLHGSIDWELKYVNGTVDKPMPFHEIEQVTGDKLKTQYRPALIFGGRNKLTSAGPYLDMLRTFERELAKCELLTIVGYSFGDDHVNKYISDWINDNSTHNIVVINPAISNRRHTYVNNILQLQKTGRLKLYEEVASEGLKKL